MLWGISWVEWFGYSASVVVAISLTMSSIIKLRWFNLAGAAMFSAYGFIIGALPVAFLNLFICGINLMYLRRMYREQDDFRIMSLSGDSEYLAYFLECFRGDIAKFFPQFDTTPHPARKAFYLLKNSAPIGVLIGRVEDEHTLLIELDYVTAAYRDFKMGAFVYGNNDFFLRQGYTTLKTPVNNSGHDDYLRRMKFIREGDYFVKKL